MTGQGDAVRDQLARTVAELRARVTELEGLDAVRVAMLRAKVAEVEAAHDDPEDGWDDLWWEGWAGGLTDVAMELERGTLTPGAWEVTT